MVCCSQGLECVHDTNALVGMTPEVNDLILAANDSWHMITSPPMPCMEQCRDRMTHGQSQGPFNGHLLVFDHPRHNFLCQGLSYSHTESSI